MKGNTKLKIVSNSKIFNIPFTFPSLINVNPTIYESLTSNGEYEVKSNISDEILQSFIDHWVYNKIPFFSKYNISQYQQLSQEFDRLKDLLQIFNRTNQNTEKNRFLHENHDLKSTKTIKNDILTQKTEKFNQIIHILFNNNGFEFQPTFFYLYHQIYKACTKENVKYLDILTRRRVRKNDFIFALNEAEKTAGVLQCITQSNKVIIPRSIEFESIEFDVTVIHSYSFKNKVKLKKIEFEKDSKVRKIESHAFFCCFVETISIPQSIEELEECWIFRVSTNDIILDPNNKYFMNFDGKFILGKSDKNNETYDVLIHSLETEEYLEIPSFIRRIEPFAFYGQDTIQVVDINEDSQLQTIGKFAFANTTIKSINIPKHVIKIENGAFCECDINFIDFADDCHLREIGKEAFFDSSIKFISIPQHVNRIGDSAFFFCGRLQHFEIEKNKELRVIENSAFYSTEIKTLSLPSDIELDDEWCNNMQGLNEIKIIEKDVKNITKFNELVLGKTDKYSDEFDVILFAPKTIKEVKIPSFIKRIGSYAFDFCEDLSKIEFEDGSQLKSIGKYAFKSTSIKRIVIPPHVNLIEDKALYECRCLNSIEFSKGSESLTVNDFGVLSNSINFLTLPSSAINFNYCFSKIKNLNHVEINQEKEKNISYFDNQIILQKSDIKSGMYDVLLFAPRNIRKVTIPSFIKHIGAYAFAHCNHLQKVDFAENSQLTSIELGAFKCSSINCIKIPQNVTKIDNYAFCSCKKLRKIEFSEKSKLNEIGDLTFSDTAIEFITIPRHATKIGKLAFSNCNKLKRIEFATNSQLRKIEKRTFSENSLECISIPRNVELIRKYAFCSCPNLKHIIIPEDSKLKFIDKYAFEDSSIECFKIVSSVNFIERESFTNCQNLQIIEIAENTNIQSIDKELFNQIPFNCVISVPPNLIK